MTFPKKPENLRLNKLIQTNITGHTHEIWLTLCRQQKKSTHQLLRELVEKYCQEQMEMKRGYGVLRA